MKQMLLQEKFPVFKLEVDIKKSGDNNAQFSISTSVIFTHFLNKKFNDFHENC